MIIVYVLLALTALFALILFWIYSKAFYIPTRLKHRVLEIDEEDARASEAKATIARLMKEFEAIEYESVSIVSKDKKTLHARYYHVADNAPLHIQCHGYRGSAMRDFCGGNKLARKEGHNTLVIDQRAHGKSEGHTITFGLMERYDVLCWINYAIERFGKDTKIFLSGVSMGAATVLMCAGLHLPHNVVGITADCPYSSPKEIILKVSSDMGFPAKLVYPFIKLSALIFGRFQLSDESVVDAVRNTNVPILLIHGEADTFVPFDMSLKIRDACKGDLTFFSVPGAGHGMSYIVDPVNYEKAVIDFINKCIKK